jgi:hypothetical protein
MRIRFLGQVLPTTLKVTVQNHPTIRWNATEHNTIVHFDIKIADSEVTVDCHMNNFEERKHYIDLYLRSLDYVYAVLDVLSFSTGKYHRLIIDRWIKPNGDRKDIYDMFFNAPEFNSAATTDPTDFGRVLSIVSVEHHLRMALRDLISGTMESHVSPVDFGRVVESLRHLISPNLDRKEGWARLLTTLRVERAFIQPITDTSTAPRHGDFSRIIGDVTTDIAKRTWILMNRYLEYRKAGNQPLPPELFPVLS